METYCFRFDIEVFGHYLMLLLNFWLRAYFILIEAGGEWVVGTEDAPMNNLATIFIKTPVNWNPFGGNAGLGYHDSLGSRFIVGKAGSSMIMHGRPLDRTWTLLASNSAAGSSVLNVKHDPDAMGWQVGDEIGIATTTRTDSPRRFITAIDGNSITIDEPLLHTHWGGMRDLAGGFSLEMAAEVINLQRSIVITGDDEDFLTQGSSKYLLGWHGGSFEAEDHNDSVYDIRYIRTDNCGQKNIMGRYCFHFHLKRQCKTCVVKGNAVVNSSQGAIVIHGTHQSLVEENVLWNSVTVGVYTEDGNEMNNTISRNVMICSNLFLCKFGNHQNDWQPESGVKEGGLFFFGMTNNVLENRVAGHEHGWWTPGGSVWLGKGQASNLICPQYAPFLTVRGNVFHDCQRFGTYPDNQHPRQLIRDEDGYVVKNEQGQMESCNEFKADGSDNGLTCFIEDNVDWHNMFVGQYAVGDISYRNIWSVNNAHGMYWKLSKNMADGVSYHIEDSMFINDPNDGVYGILHSFLPGAAFTFRMKNVTYAGQGQHPNMGAIASPQHCGLGKQAPGTCTVQYLFENVVFKDTVNTHVSFGASGGYPMAPSYITFDDSLGGFGQALSPHHNGYNNIQGCEADVSVFGRGVGCDKSLRVRRLMIWSEDMGSIKVSGKGYDIEPNWAGPSYGSNAGHLTFTDKGESGRFNKKIRNSGYGIYLIVGETYVISGLQWISDVYFIFSDQEIAAASGDLLEEEYVNLVLEMEGQNRSCRVSAAESRLFVSQNGIARGAQRGDCTEQFWQLAVDVGFTTTTTTTTTATTPEWHECPCSNDAHFDTRCISGADPFGGLGCNMCGLPACRICGVGIYPDCPEPPSTTEPGSTLSTTSSTPLTQTEPPHCECGGAQYDETCSEDDADHEGCGACGLDNCRLPVVECCGETKWDVRCWSGADPHGGLGCNACGIPQCRICGTGIYPPCPGLQILA